MHITENPEGFYWSHGMSSNEELGKGGGQHLALG